MSLELDPLIWIAISFLAGLLLVGIVWLCFCRGGGGDKGDVESRTSESDEESDSYSSTRTITNSGRRSRRRNPDGKKSAGDDDGGNSSCTDSMATTDDDDSSSVEGKRKRRIRRKRRNNKSSNRQGGGGGKSEQAYQYKSNGYGFHDPFSEWAPKEKKYKDPDTMIQQIYPKSPSMGRKHTTIDIPS